MVAAGVASGTYLLASQAFVAPMQPLSSSETLSSSSTATGYDNLEGGVNGSSSAVAAIGFAGVLAMTASASRRTVGSRTQRRAEPVSAAAAAAAAVKAGSAAKAAAAAKGAAKAAGAVAGSAGSGTMVQAAGEAEGEFDPEVGGKIRMIAERGTPEYEKAMQQKKARNDQAWERYTGRNPDGNFGDPMKSGNANAYDPFVAVQGGLTDEARRSGFAVGDFNPAVAIGVTEPLGYFDPLGFCANNDVAEFRKFRTAELKHGRVAMMGALGAVVQHYVKFPGFEKVPAGLDAINTAPGSYGTIALFLVAGVLELGVWTESPDKEPGNFGDPAGLGFYTEEMRNRELNNGRAAMFAVIGIIAAELLTGKDAIEQLGLP